MPSFDNAGGVANTSEHQRAIVARVRQCFRERFGNRSEIRLVMAPGRVNLIGDHTDYNDGLALPMTIDSGIYWAVAKREDTRVNAYSMQYDETLEYDMAATPAFKPGGWSSYVGGVVEELRKRELLSTGFDGVVVGDVVLGAGLSSSAALEVATAIAMQSLYDFHLSPLGMVHLCQDVEHIYAGVQCGIMDQFASRLGRKRHALLLDCRSLAYENVPWVFDDIQIVIIMSGVERSLAASKYNERRAECLQGVSYFQTVDESIKALRDVTTEHLLAHRAALTPVVSRRCEHIVTENQRVLDAADFMRRGDPVGFGRLMNESHASLRDLYEVSCPELDALVDIAQSTEGVYGARMTGAGFGGCTVNLVASGAVEALVENIRVAYPKVSGLEATILPLSENTEAGQIAA